jgi:hypothetical protein
MKDYLDNVKDELKRVDHIIYVSLKYTRTVDVIKHAVDRMISAFDFGIEALLQKAKRRRKTLEIPDQPLKRCEMVKEMYKDDQKLVEFIDFYLLLRTLSKAEYTKKEEYRRNVAMIAKLDSGMVEVSIDVLHEYEAKMKSFVEYLEQILGLAEERL